MTQLEISSSECTILFTEIKLEFYECDNNIHLKYKNSKNLKLHRYGNKEFCKFKINKEFNKEKGIYCFAISGKIVYIGRCLDNFNKRINTGYGNISPRNCYEGGQPTNCRINSNIEINRDNIQLGIYTMADKDDDTICQLEKELLKRHGEVLEWNIQKT